MKTKPELIEERVYIVKNFFGWIVRNKWWVIIVLIVCGLLCWWLCPFGKNKKNDYITVDVIRGDIVQTVTASGEIQPVNTINVGSSCLEK